MKVPAAEFESKCLTLLDRVHDRGEPVTITKRGKAVAKLVSAGDTNERPWGRLRNTAQWKGDPLAPAVARRDIEDLKTSALPRIAAAAHHPRRRLVTR